MSDETAILCELCKDAGRLGPGHPCPACSDAQNALANRIDAIKSQALARYLEVRDRGVSAGFNVHMDIELKLVDLFWPGIEALRAIEDGEGDAQEIARQALALMRVRTLQEEKDLANV